MIFVSLKSGSSGNGYILSDGSETLLFDCGVPRRMIVEVLTQFSLPSPRNVFISHEHGDHTSTLGIIQRAFCPTFFLTNGTHQAIAHVHPDSHFEVRPPREEIDIGGFCVRLIPKSHDARDPVYFEIEHLSGEKIVIATDMGKVDAEFLQIADASTTLLIESNYDTKMLREGFYSAQLKARIASSRGHLSNAQTAELLAQLSCTRTQKVILGHLSAENNTVQLAYNASRKTLPMFCDLIVAAREKITILHSL